MNILDTLAHYKSHAESQGLIVYAITLKGSQNYNLDDKESGIVINHLVLTHKEQQCNN